MGRGFLTDLSVGQKLENFLCLQLQQKYPQTFTAKGKFKDYDISIPELGHTLECKTDLKSRLTGNIAIEFFDRGKPSGIATTKSSHWVYRLWSAQHNSWIFVFAKIEEWHKICEGKKIVKGGDGFLAKMYLVPVKEIVNNPNVSIRLFTKSWKEFKIAD